MRDRRRCGRLLSLAVAAVMGVVLALVPAPAFAATALPQITSDQNRGADGTVPMVIQVQLDQDAARIQVLACLKKYRADAYDTNIAWGDTTMQAYLANKGISRDTYVNGIYWSQTMEAIAVQRAVEAIMVTGHARTDGTTPWTALQDGKQSYGEDVAFGYYGGLNPESRMEQFYSEKSDYVNKTGATTGHYTSMVDPSNTIFGAGDVCITNGTAQWPETLTLEIGAGTSADESSLGYKGTYDATAYAQDWPSDSYGAQSWGTFDVTLNATPGTSTLTVGKSTTVSVTATTEHTNGSTNTVTGTVPVSAVSFSSSDTSVATVDADGKVTAVAEGTAVITVICGSETATVTITVAKGLAAAAVTASDVTYTGSAAKPTVTVTLDGKALTEGTDYTVSYDGRVNVGTGTVTITGKGTYAGQITIETYQVVPASIVDTTAQSDFVAYSPKGVTPKVSLTFDGRTLVEGTDYELSVIPVNAVGWYFGGITVTGKGNFTGSMGLNLYVDARDIADATVSGLSGATYTGSTIAEEPTVTVDGVTLTKDTDYTLSWSDNVNAGTATVTVTGAGNYTGSTTATYAIMARDIGTATRSLSPTQVTYDPSTGTHPTLTLTYNGIALKEGTDYTVSWPTYGSTGSVGSKTFSVTGKGNFSRAVSGTYDVVAASIANADVSYDASVAYVSGATNRPSVTVTYKGFILSEGTDYAISWPSSGAAGSHSFTITGKGNYTGNVSKTYTVVEGISIADAKFDDVAMVPKAELSTRTSNGTKTPGMTLRLDGKELVEGTDYRVTRIETVEGSDDHGVMVEGMGKYAGTARGDLFAYGFDRLWGNSSWETMAAIVDSIWTGHSDYVVVATGLDFYDALSASAVAGLHNAPIITTPGAFLGADAKAEIQRLSPSHIIVMGGTAAISDQCFKTLQGLVSNPANVVRYYGDTARATACDAYEKNVGQWGNTCIVATWTSFHDALSISPYAYSRQAPIFLTNPSNQLDGRTLADVRNFSHAIIVGGTAVVPASVEDQLKGMGLSVTRLGGDTAIDTSATIAKWEIDHGMYCNGMCVARGDDYHDALAGGPLAGRANAVLVLSNPGNYKAIAAACQYQYDSVPKGNTDYAMCRAVTGHVLGGPAAVPEATLDWCNHVYDHVR